MVHDIIGKSLSDLSITTDDIFFLDSNILLWLYGGYSINQLDIYKVSVYSSFVSLLMQSGVDLWTSAGNLQEVLNLVERREFELYKIRTGNRNLRKKDYRKIPAERTNVKSKMNAVKSIILSLCDVKRLVITKEQINRFVSTVDSQYYDPMDFFVVENAIANRRINILTDDRDFRNDNRISVFTVI